jgi:heme exporter protein D
MISEGTYGFIVWGAYIWFVIGVVLIAVPAIKELIDIIKK